MTTRQSVQSAPDMLDAVVDLSSLPDNLEPLPDAMQQDPVFTESKTIMETRYEDRSDVFVSGNTAVYYNERNRNHKVLPDCYVAFDVNADAIAGENAYATWEAGKPPDFVLEIASESTFDTDMDVKPGIYADIGVLEYWRFDSTGGRFYGQPLIGGRLVDGAYSPIELTVNADGMLTGYSTVLGLSLCADGDRLRFYDSVAGGYLLSMSEERRGRLAAEARALVEETARLTAEQTAIQERNAKLQEREARLAAEKRLRELEEKLRNR